MRLFNKKYLFFGALVVFAAVLALCISRCGDSPSSPPPDPKSFAQVLLQQIVLYSHDLYSQDPAVNDAALLSVRYYDLVVRMEDLPQAERAWLESTPEYQEAVARIRRFKEQTETGNGAN